MAISGSLFTVDGMSDRKRADEAIRMTVGAGDGAVGFFCAYSDMVPVSDLIR